MKNSRFLNTGGSADTNSPLHRVGLLGTSWWKSIYRGRPAGLWIALTSLCNRIERGVMASSSLSKRKWPTPDHSIPRSAESSRDPLADSRASKRSKQKHVYAWYTRKSDSHKLHLKSCAREYQEELSHWTVIARSWKTIVSVGLGEQRVLTMATAVLDHDKFGHWLHSLHMHEIITISLCCSHNIKPSIDNRVCRTRETEFYKKGRTSPSSSNRWKEGYNARFGFNFLS